MTEDTDERVAVGLRRCSRKKSSTRLLRVEQKPGRIFLQSSTGRIAAKRKTASIKFSHMPKISIFTPQGRMVAPIHVKLDTAEGHVGLLGRANFLANRCNFTLLVLCNPNKTSGRFGLQISRLLARRKCRSLEGTGHHTVSDTCQARQQRTRAN